MNQYFSYDAFYLGGLFFSFIIISILINGLVCIISRTKIRELSIFYNYKFFLHKEIIFGSTFILGWLPLGGYVKPLGMNTSDNVKQEIPKEDLPFCAFNKPKWVKIIFKTTNWMVLIISLIVSFILQNKANDIGADIVIIGKYLLVAFQSIFMDELANEKLSILTREIITNRNIVFFAYMILLLIYLIITPFMKIMVWFTYSEIKKSPNKVLIFFSGLITVFTLWLLLWKFPKFIFSFFSLKQNLIYMINFLCGIITMGIISFGGILFVLKNIPLHLKK